MKSPNNQDWLMMGLFAVQCTTEMLERTVSSGNQPQCIDYFSPNAVLQWRQTLKNIAEACEAGVVFTEARALSCDLVSVSGWNAVVETSGCLFCYGFLRHGDLDFADASLFKVRTTCRCCLRPLGIRSNIELNPIEGLASRIRTSPFQLQITHFNYETIS